MRPKENPLRPAFGWIYSHANVGRAVFDGKTPPLWMNVGEFRWL
jgi:hypothetical protein